MSQLSKVTHSRNQWKAKAKQRSDHNRYLRKQLARLKAERTQARQEFKETQTRLRQLESQVQAVAVRPKVDVVGLALNLFLEARISFRAVCRVLALLASDLGIKRAPCPQTVINWIIRLSIVRIECARGLRGLPLAQAPFSNGLIWMIDVSIGLGSGKILAVLAIDAHHHQLLGAASALEHVHLSGSQWVSPGRAKRLPRCSIVSSLRWADRRPISKTVAVICTKPPTCWRHEAWAAPVSTISPTLPRACSSTITNITRPLSGFCRPAGASRANSSKPSWRVWHHPPCAPKPALCRCTACSPGQIGCSSCRPLVGRRPAPS